MCRRQEKDRPGRTGGKNWYGRDVMGRGRPRRHVGDADWVKAYSKTLGGGGDHVKKKSPQCLEHHLIQESTRK